MQTWLGVSTHIIIPNFVKIGRSIVEIENFQNGRRCHLGFLKLQNFIGYLGGEGRDASARQISLKSVNRL